MERRKRKRNFIVNCRIIKYVAQMYRQHTFLVAIQSHWSAPRKGTHPYTPVSQSESCFCRSQSKSSCFHFLSLSGILIIYDLEFKETRRFIILILPLPTLYVFSVFITWTILICIYNVVCDILSIFYKF